MGMVLGGTEKYDRVTIALHWVVAVLVLGLWTAGQTADWFPKGPLRSAIWSTHVVTGFGLALILCVRLLWRLTAGRRLPDVGSPLMRRSAALMQGALYVLLLFVVAVGLANAFDRGVGLYGLFKLPQIGDPELKHRLTDVHGVAANILLALAACHAGAALAHHYIWKDTVLRRMIPGASSR